MRWRCSALLHAEWDVLSAEKRQLCSVAAPAGPRLEQRARRESQDLQHVVLRPQGPWLRGIANAGASQVQLRTHRRAVLSHVACTALLPLSLRCCNVPISPTKFKPFISTTNIRLKDLDVMSAIPSLDTEMANIPHPTGVHAQHVPHNSGLPVQSSIGQQVPQPYQALSQQPQQQYTYQYPVQQPIANTTSTQPNTGAGCPIVIDVNPSADEADKEPWR